MHRIPLAIVLVFSLVAGCASPQIEPVGPKGPDLQTMSAREIKAEAKSLMSANGFDARTKTTLLKQLDSFVVEKRIVKLMKTKGATAVVVYSAGEGGFIVKGAGGNGLVNFKGGDQRVEFEMSGQKVGAVAGGGSNRGIAIAFGLVDQRRFAGNYSMSGTGAKAVADGVATGIANYDGDIQHELRYIATGSGLSADFGIGNFSVKFSK